MQTFKEVKQGSEQWHDLRLGIITMSELQPVTVKGQGEDGFGAGALTYMNKLIGALVTGKKDDSFKGNQDSERGHILEPEVRKLYMRRTDSKVDEVGFILNHHCGYSPDGLIGRDGLLEIKTKKPHLQCQVILDNVVPADHYDQCMGGLWISEREWIDFVSYAEGMPLFVKRLYRDEKKIREYMTRTKDFYDLMEQRIEKILSVDRRFAAAA
jgi:hypothetical protein